MNLNFLSVSVVNLIDTGGVMGDSLFLGRFVEKGSCVSRVALRVNRRCLFANEGVSAK